MCFLPYNLDINSLQLFTNLQYIHSVYYFFIYVGYGSLRRSISCKDSKPFYCVWVKIWTIITRVEFIFIVKIKETFNLTLAIWYVLLKEKQLWNHIYSMIKKIDNLRHYILRSKSELNNMLIWLLHVLLRKKHLSNCARYWIVIAEVWDAGTAQELRGVGAICRLWEGGRGDFFSIFIIDQW